MNSLESAQTKLDLGDKQPVIFCDFDGTITDNDNIIAIMEHFNPEGWTGLVEQLTNKEISLQNCVGSMFGLLPSSRHQEIADYAIQNAKIRKGFPELLQFAEKHGIPFLVTSGGIDFFLKPILKPYLNQIKHVYCNESDFNGAQIEILWPHSCDEHCANQGCGMCKTSIIRSYPGENYFRILIGDSISDFEGAKIADLVFSRSHLTDLCEELKLPHFAFTDFFSVIETINKAITK
jgi:2-hydroxy-3-keto-5-methylthiopentenyl-1-phosphate phosphatase